MMKQEQVSSGCGRVGLLDFEKEDLLYKQMKLAETNATMAIWLGKQFLGQSEVRKPAQKGNAVTKKIMPVHPVTFYRMYAMDLIDYMSDDGKTYPIFHGMFLYSDLDEPVFERGQLPEMLMDRHDVRPKSLPESIDDLPASVRS